MLNDSAALCSSAYIFCCLQTVCLAHFTIPPSPNPPTAHPSARTLAHSQGPPKAPLVLGVGASKMPPATKGVTKWSAPTKLRQALVRNILRRSGGLEADRPVLLLPLNEFRTTLCCRCV